MKYTLNTRIKKILKDKQTVEFLLKYIPNLFDYKELKYVSFLRLKVIYGRGSLVGLNREQEYELMRYLVGNDIPEVKIKKFRYKNICLKYEPNYKNLTFSTYNETAIPSSIIKANYHNSDNILLKKYNRLKWEEHSLNKLTYASHFVTWNLFKINYYNCNVDIKYYIHKNLNAKRYLYLYLDEFYVKSSSNFENYHNTHDYAIVGYNIETDSYKLIGYGRNYFESITLTWFELQTAIKSESNINQTCMAISLRWKNSISKKIQRKTKLEFIRNFYLPDDSISGYNVFLNLINEIEKKQNVDKRYIHFLIEYHNYLLKFINIIDVTNSEITKTINLTLHRIWLRTVKNEIKKDMDLSNIVIEELKTIYDLHVELKTKLGFSRN